MRIARRCLRLTMPQHLANDRQSHAVRRGNAGKAVAQIMDAHVVEPGRTADGAPRLFEIDQCRTGKATDNETIRVGAEFNIDTSRYSRR